MLNNIFGKIPKRIVIAPSEYKLRVSVGVKSFIAHVAFKVYCLPKNTFWNVHNKYPAPNKIPNAPIIE